MTQTFHSGALINLVQIRKLDRLTVLIDASYFGKLIKYQNGVREEEREILDTRNADASRKVSYLFYRFGANEAEMFR